MGHRRDASSRVHILLPFLFRLDGRDSKQAAGLRSSSSSYRSRHSHTYTRTGYLFHLPLPTQSTLHLTITRLHKSNKAGKADEADKVDKADKADNPDKVDHAETDTGEPYLVQLSPARPVQAVTTRNEAGLGDMMRMMRDVADRIDGLDWGTGR